MRDAPNNREDTLLLVYLRERFRAETAGGQAHLFAEAVAMYDYVSRLRPASATATDKIADEGRGANATSYSKLGPARGSRHFNTSEERAPAIAERSQ